MPIYEYECEKCGDRFEFFQVGSQELVSCARCESTNLKRLFSTFSFSGGGKKSSSSSGSSSSCSSCTASSCRTCNK